MATRIGIETVEKCAAAWSDVLPRLRDGELVSKVAEEYGLTRAHLWAYRNADPGLRAEWAEAMLDSADALAEIALETARNTDIDSRRARVMCDMLMLVAAKRNPERYADRSRHDINVRTIDYTQVLQRAERRLAAQAAGQVIEAEVLRPALAAMRDSSESDAESTS